MRPSAPSRRSPSAAPSPVRRRSSTASPRSSGPSSTADRLDPASAARGPAAAGRPRRRQRAGGRHRAGRHRELERHPAHRRPERRPGLRLDQLRARRGPPDVGAASTSPTSRRRTGSWSTRPETWTVTSNTGAESVSEAAGGVRTWTFPDTPTLSTYVVVVNAGPFHEVRRQHDGYDLGFYCRQSLVGGARARPRRPGHRHPAGTGVLRRAVRRAVPAGSATTRCSCRTSAVRWRTGAASRTATPSSPAPRPATPSGRCSRSSCSTRWPTCGSATW